MTEGNKVMMCFEYINILTGVPLHANARLAPGTSHGSAEMAWCIDMQCDDLSKGSLAFLFSLFVGVTKRESESD